MKDIDKETKEVSVANWQFKSSMQEQEYLMSPWEAAKRAELISERKEKEKSNQGRDISK